MLVFEVNDLGAPQCSWPDTLCQCHRNLTNVDTSMSAARLLGCSPGSAGAHQPFAETVNELAVGRGKVREEAVDRLDNHAPLGETGHGAERVEPRLHLHRHADTELRIVF